jgi:hypothetical protein
MIIYILMEVYSTSFKNYHYHIIQNHTCETTAVINFILHVFKVLIVHFTNYLYCKKLILLHFNLQFTDYVCYL